MCPRFVWTKIRPGDLVTQALLKQDVNVDLYDVPDSTDRTVIATVKPGKVVLCVSMDDQYLFVLTTDCHVGWTERIWWEKTAPDSEKEYEEMGPIARA